MSTEIRAEVMIDRPLTQCTDQEATRYALASVHVTPSQHDGKVWLAACDSRVLALTLADGRTDAPHLLPGKMAKPHGKSVTRAQLNGVWRSESGHVIAERFRPDGKKLMEDTESEGRFPRTVDVLPAAQSGDVVISLNAELLANLAKAIGDNGRDVTLIIRDGVSAVAVHGKHGIGVAMPLSLGSGKHEHNAENVRTSYNATRDEFRTDFESIPAAK